MIRAAAEILLAAPERGQRERLACSLEAEGWIIRRARNAREAVLMAERLHPDAIVVDSRLCGASGPDLWRELRGRTGASSVPVFLLADGAERSGPDTGPALSCHASDLITRLKANLHGQDFRPRDAVLCFDHISVEFEAYRVRLRGEPVHVGLTEFRLLAALIEQPGRVWQRADLLEHVWGPETAVGTRTVDAHIARLRRALGQRGNDYPIRTVRGVGYAMG